MIWVGLGILAALIFLIYMLDRHLGMIRAQNEAIGNAFNVLGAAMGDLYERLGVIADNTDRLPKARKRRLPEYPGDPLGEDYDE